MYSLDDLKQQNEDIAALCSVLSVLVEQRNLHNNRYVCELMSRFKEKVWMHLVFEDNTIYAELARHDDAATRDTARGFHDSARDIKKRFSGYVKHWCNPAVTDEEHETLANESREILGVIMERIKYENEHMFPLISDS